MLYIYYVNIYFGTSLHTLELLVVKFTHRRVKGTYSSKKGKFFYQFSVIPFFSLIAMLIFPLS